MVAGESEIGEGGLDFADAACADYPDVAGRELLAELEEISDRFEASLVTEAFEDRADSTVARQPSGQPAAVIFPLSHCAAWDSGLSVLTWAPEVEAGSDVTDEQWTIWELLAARARSRAGGEGSPHAVPDGGGDVVGEAVADKQKLVRGAFGGSEHEEVEERLRLAYSQRIWDGCNFE
jgi:hypothetical protein